MEYVATKNVLVRQEDATTKKGQRYKKDVMTKTGQKINLTDKEAIALWGALDIPETEKKRLLRVSKQEGYKRRI